MAQSGYENSMHRVALWGPSGSGKTWMIHALGRSLVNFHPTDPDFSYELREFTDAKFEPPIIPFKPPKGQSTSEPVDFVWLFQRRPKQNTYAHQISTHTHILQIHDIPGNEALLLTDDHRQNFHGIQLLLLLLDPTCFSDSPIRDSANFDGPKFDEIDISDLLDEETLGNELESPIVLSKDEYINAVMQVLDYVSGAGVARPSVAVCLTKSDLWDKKMDAETAISRWFGHQMGSIIDQYGKGFPLKKFSMTASGYLDGGERRPNFDRQTGWLLNENHWKPEGVLGPLIWHLENVERQKINRTAGFFEELVGKDRISNYIPYPNLD